LKRLYAEKQEAQRERLNNVGFGLMQRRAFLTNGIAAALGSRLSLLAQFRRNTPVEFSQTVQAVGAELQVDFAHGDFALGRDAVIQKVKVAANVVKTYYGKFPVKRVRLLVVPTEGRGGVLQGTTWGNVDGFPAFLRLRIGTDVSKQELADDWIITHELVHTGLADLPDDQHWLEEGIASYVEPIARAQAGDLDVSKMWAGMMAGMHNGEPEAGDQGLDHTHTWGRTYWGGAMFCLMAEVSIREATTNRVGLQDGLRAIVDAGGTINTDRPLARLLSIADKATGTNVLSTMYTKWSATPVPIDLPALWQKFGIHKDDVGVVLDDSAPLASTRLAITRPHA
jgi:hypothetical protein